MGPINGFLVRTFFQKSIFIRRVYELCLYFFLFEILPENPYFATTEKHKLTTAFVPFLANLLCIAVLKGKDRHNNDAKRLNQTQLWRSRPRGLEPRTSCARVTLTRIRTESSHLFQGVSGTLSPSSILGERTRTTSLKIIPDSLSLLMMGVVPGTPVYDSGSRPL